MNERFTYQCNSYCIDKYKYERYFFCLKLKMVTFYDLSCSLLIDRFAIVSPTERQLGV